MKACKYLLLLASRHAIEEVQQEFEALHAGGKLVAARQVPDWNSGNVGSCVSHRGHHHELLRAAAAC